MIFRHRRAFTLIELLVVIGVIALLVALVSPALSAARRRGVAVKCAANLHVLGQGLTMYTQENGDVLVPGRLPNVDACNWYSDIKGGRKYRPTFLAMMGSNVGIAPFDDPQPCRGVNDRFGEPADQQNYGNPVFVCPAVPEWTDERNGSYGYNYQFLGNSRLSNSSDAFSFKHWPVVVTRIRDAANTVAVADSMGTAASFARSLRLPYENNARVPEGLGNEGFNLDPPRVDPTNGEMAGLPEERTSVDPRHLERATVLWVDGHATSETPAYLGYQVASDGVVGLDGNNARWSGTGRDVAWTPGYGL